MVQQPFSVHPHLRPLETHIFPSSKTSHWQSDQVELTPYAQFLECLEKWSSLTWCCCEICALFSISEKMVSSIAKTAALFLGHNHVPMIHHQLWPWTGRAFCSSLHNWIRWSLWSFFKRRGTNFAAIRLMWISSDRMRWHDQYESPMLLQISWIVYLLG